MGIPLLRAHVTDLQLVSPSLGVFLFVLDAVSLNGPLSRTLPLHNTTTFVGTQDNNELASSAKVGVAAIPTKYIWELQVSLCVVMFVY